MFPRDQMLRPLLQATLYTLLGMLYAPFPLCLQITGQGLGCGSDSRMLAPLAEGPEVHPPCCIN